MSDATPNIQRKPAWLRVNLKTNKSFQYIKGLVQDGRLHTVCEEARCPNIHECWGEHKTATFMVLGDVCTRRCRFCAIKTGLPRLVDKLEPARVAQSVAKLALRHVVITMVNRDELSDGGAAILAATVCAIRNTSPDCSVEVLTSDFMGKRSAIQTVMDSKPDIMSHNLETVRRLTPQVRSRSDYDRSLEVLQIAREIQPDAVTKSSLMLGLGETKEELCQAMDDMLDCNVQMLNMGQYLQPSVHHLPVQKYWHPDEFAELKEIAYEKGFTHCESAPLVRSSYHAGEDYESYRKKIHPLWNATNNTATNTATNNVDSKTTISK